MMMRVTTNKAERLSEIERLLFNNPDGLRAVEIAEACGVDRRTIYRDLASLSEMGVPVYQQDGRFLLNTEYYMAPLRLNVNEALALFLAVRGWMHQTDQQNPHIIPALTKVSGALPAPLAVHTQVVAETMRSQPVDRSFVKIMETFTRAWCEQRRAQLWYRDSQMPTRVVEFATYCLEQDPGGQLCAVGYDYTRRQLSGFRLQCVKRIQLLPVRYEIPARFDRRRYLSSIPGAIPSAATDRQVEVVLGFSAEATPDIRKYISQSGYRFVILDDGRSLLSLTVSDWRSLIPWLRSWGAHVEVLEPRDLRQTMADEALRLANVYAART